MGILMRNRFKIDGNFHLNLGRNSLTESSPFKSKTEKHPKSKSQMQKL
jgi:hypothetical protein